MLEGQSLHGLLWLQRAYREGCQDPALPYLIATAIRPVDAIALILDKHQGSVTHAAFSPDGLRIITTSEDHSALLWDAHSGQLLSSLLGHSDQVRYAAFSTDGTRVITVSSDQTARLWDGQTGALRSLLRGHTGRILHAAWSPDGTRVVTASEHLINGLRTRMLEDATLTAALPAGVSSQRIKMR